MTEYSFKPALLAKRLTYVVEPDRLVCRDAKGGTKWQLDWDEVTSARFVETTIRRNSMRRLDLLTGKGKTRYSVACNSASKALDDPDVVVHLNLCGTILDRLASDNPEMRATLGEYGVARHAMFAVGILAILIVAGMGVALIAVPVSNDKLMAGLVPILGLGVFGAIICRSYWPWSEPLRLDPRILAATLRAMANPGNADSAT